MPLPSLVVFPLHPIDFAPAGPQCGCSRGADCSRVGKHPAIEWKELKLGDPSPRPKPGGGVGIKTGAAPLGSGLVVVDLDSEAACGLFDSLGDCPETYTVGTGRGLHLYFKHPGFPVKNSAGDLGKGIDIRGEGGFVVAPGSPHVSGFPYKVVRDTDPAEAPAWLLEWLRARPAPAAVQSYEGDVSGSERERRRDIYAKYLETAQPCVSGGGGDTRLFEVVQYGAYDLALPTEDVLELVAEHFDPRCEPPWGPDLEERVLHKAHGAKTSSTRPRNAPLLAGEAELLDFLEPTKLPTPEAPPAPDDPDCGLNIRWGPWADPPVPPSYLVDGLLLENKVSMVFAEPGSIKSWTAISLAEAVSTGMPWIRERAVKQSPVLYIDFEDGKDEFHRRVHLLAEGTERPDLGYLYSPGRIDEEEIWLKLEKLQKSRGVGLIVLDTMAGGTTNVDENDRNAANALVLAGRFTEATPATVLVLHHANRAGDIRGTSAFKANVDALFKLETLSDEDGVHRAKLSCVKSGQRKVLPVFLEFTDEGLRRFEPPSREADKEDKADKRTLAELEQEILLLIENHGPIQTQELVRAHVRAKSTTVSAIMAELQAKGSIFKSEAGWIGDNIHRARARVLEAIEKLDPWTQSALAKAAGVGEAFIQKMLDAKEISPKASGKEVRGFIVLPR